MGEASEREKAQAAMADAVRRIGEAHAAMAATLARMVDSGERLADHEASVMLDLHGQVDGALWDLGYASGAWRSAVRDEHTRAALAKAQARGDG